jgi:hypothetical protein
MRVGVSDDAQPNGIHVLENNELSYLKVLPLKKRE